MGTRLEVENPLENSLVLSHIFQYCRLKDLKSCRLVSRLWRDSSRLALRSSAVVTIHPNEEDGRTMSDFKLLFSKKYDNGQGQIQVKEAPFTNFHVQITVSGWFYNFWGSSIKVLKLDWVQLTSGAFVKIIFVCCQNLEKLALSYVKVRPPIPYTEIFVEETGQTRRVPRQIKWDEIEENEKLKSIVFENDSCNWTGSDWIEFLSRLPSLQDITVINISVNYELKQLFRSVKAILKRHPNKLNLKLVDLRRLQYTSPIILSVLLDANLHLESLELGPSFLYKSSSSTSLPDILNNHSSSLKKLVLERNTDNALSNDFQLSLSNQNQLEKLQELTLYHYQDAEYRLIEFLKLAPNLRKVLFWSSSGLLLGVEGKDVSATQDIRLFGCTELEFIVPDLTIQDLEHLISWTPNLKKLRIRGLNNDMFSMVCQGWPKLVKMDDVVSEVTDSGITGLDAEDVAKINKRIRSVWRPTTVRRPNITSLKELQTLSLRAGWLGSALSVREYIKIDLGHCAVTCGIGLLPNLRHMNIENFNLKGGGGRRGKFWTKVCDKYPWPIQENLWRNRTMYSLE